MQTGWITGSGYMCRDMAGVTCNHDQWSCRYQDRCRSHAIWGVPFHRKAAGSTTIFLVTVRSALERGKLVIENRRLRQALKQQQGSVLVPMLGESRAMHAVKELIERVGPTEARVLITGEPGTGKELAARWIHTQSLRREGPWSQ